MLVRQHKHSFNVTVFQCCKHLLFWYILICLITSFEIIHYIPKIDTCSLNYDLRNDPTCFFPVVTYIVIMCERLGNTCLLRIIFGKEILFMKMENTREWYKTWCFQDSMIDTLLGSPFYRCLGNLLLQHASLHLIFKESYFMTHYHFMLHHTVHRYH